uniref:Uncharacterized protein n=1 Tax=Colletotrichum fructicola (strain Nara gc5) TaxID=1213859 RepID=L2FVW9_COLFN
MFNLIRVLKADEVDASPLKEPKFGQIMPLIMPLIIVLGVFEASSNKNEKNQRESNDGDQNLLQASTHDPVSNHQLHNTAFGLPTRARTTGAEGPWSRNHTDVSVGSTAAAASHGIQQPRVRRIDYGDEDGIPLIAHTPATTADDQNSHAPNPTIQAAGDKKEAESRMLLAQTVYEQVPLLCTFMLVTVAGQIGFIAALLIDYRWTVITFFIINFGFGAVQTSIALRWLWQAMMKRSEDSEQGTLRTVNRFCYA